MFIKKVSLLDVYFIDVLEVKNVLWAEHHNFKETGT
jgi:hypothetical protein